VKKPPTTENTTHEPNDAPAEPEVQRLLRERRRLRAKLDKTERELTDRLCSGDVLTLPVTEEALELAGVERVREYETTGDLLGMFASTATEHAYRNPDDADALGIAAILTAVEHAHRNPDDPEAAVFLAQVGKHDPRPQRSSGLVGHAERYLREPVRGPRTRDEQADMLCGSVAIEIESPARQIAQSFVARVRIAPDIAKHTCVPVTGAWRGTQAEIEAVSAVEKAVAVAKLDGKDAEAITRAALIALDYPKSKAKNVFTHRDKLGD
jgi:hypothetical protein